MARGNTMDAEYVKGYARQKVEIELDEDPMRRRVEEIVSPMIDQIVKEIIKEEFADGIRAMVRTQLRPKDDDMEGGS